MKFKFTVNEFEIIIDGKRQPYIGFYHLIDGIPFSGKKYQKFVSKRLYQIQKDDYIGPLNKLYYGKE